MSIVVRSLTNGAWWPRTLRPTVLLAVHITGNAQLPSASNERDYANRAGSGGPSAHDYLDRDGSGIEALDPAKWCAWSNGDVQSPNLAITTVAAAVKAGVNPNKIVYREVECVGYPGTAPVTDAQLEQLARFVAADAKATGLPINRTTVTTHADWNSVSRVNCAFPPVVREAKLAQIIARAKALTAPEVQPMRSFALPSPIGGARFVGPGHAAIPLDGAPLDGPWPDGTNWTVFGEVVLTAPVAGGVAGADRSHVLLVMPSTTHDGKPWPYAKPACILTMDTDWPKGKTAPPPAVTTTDVTVTVKGVAKTLSF